MGNERRFSLGKSAFVIGSKRKNEKLVDRKQKNYWDSRDYIDSTLHGPDYSWGLCSDSHSSGPHYISGVFCGVGRAVVRTPFWCI